MLKVKDKLILREIAGNWVVIPAGTRVVEYNSIISLNTSGALLWRCLEQGTEAGALVQELVSKYGIDRTSAQADVNDFINMALEKGFIQIC